MSNFWQPICNEKTKLDILYARLSRDDGLDDRESNSISHQKEILTEYAAKNGFDHFFKTNKRKILSQK